MKAFFLVAVILLVILAAFAIANAVFSADNSETFSTGTISTSLNTGATSVGAGMKTANAAGTAWGTTADGKAADAATDGTKGADAAAAALNAAK